MKKKILIPMFFVAVATIAVIAVSCQKENGPKEPTDIYEQIGKLHNEGLELFITKVEKTNLTKSTFQPLSREEYNKIQTEVSAEMVAKLYGLAPNNPAVANVMTASAVINPLTKSNSDPESLFTDHVKEFIDQLKILVQANNDTPYLIDAVRHLEEKIISRCTDEEQVIIRTTASVAIYSAQYWEKNGDRWGAVLVGMEQAQMQKIATKKSPEEADLDMIIISDGIGAAAGAIKGGMAGAAGGTVVVPGVGSAAGATVGAIGGGLAGAIEASIAAGLGSWIYSWF